MTHLDLTNEQKEQAEATGQCPECEKAMALLQGGQTGKKELYCKECHLSVPLWKA